MADTVSSSEFAAFRADVDERISNIAVQMTLLNNRITEVANSATIKAFPDEEAQVREQVLTAFQEEISTLVADLNKLKSDVSALNLEVFPE